jgi:hypothetical protein
MPIFVAFFSATIDGRNLIFVHKLHIGTPYRGKRFNFDLDLTESYEPPRTAFPKVQADDKVSKSTPYEIHMSNISLERTAEFIQDQRSKNAHHLFNEKDCPSQDSSFRQHMQV